MNTQTRFQVRCCTGTQVWGSPKALRYTPKVKGAVHGAESAVRGAEWRTGAVRGADGPRTQRRSPSRLGTPALGITWMQGNPTMSQTRVSAVCSACCSRRILTRTDNFQGQSGQPRKQWHAEMADKIATKRLLTLILSLRAEMNDWNTRLVKARMLLISLLCAEQDLAGGKLTIS